MSADFHPWRRNMHFVPYTRPAPIRPLIPHLAFTDDPKRWGCKFRFGLLAIAKDDFSRIATAMHCAPPFFNCTGASP
ncbi:MAG: hypothetical protein Q4A28_07565 [Brachymonas sp.]|nr:hypothetical protein [Brachymonas sp.]